MKSITPDEIEAFIIEHCPEEQWQDPKKIRPWIEYMMGNGCLEAFTEDGKTILAVMCSRMTSDVNDFYDINTKGDCLVVDLLLSVRDNILKSISAHLIQKHGKPNNVHWKRGDRTTTVLTDRIARHLLPN